MTKDRPVIPLSPLSTCQLWCLVVEPEKAKEYKDRMREHLHPNVKLVQRGGKVLIPLRHYMEGAVRCEDMFIKEKSAVKGVKRLPAGVEVYGAVAIVKDEQIMASSSSTQALFSFYPNLQLILLQQPIAKDDELRKPEPKILYQSTNTDQCHFIWARTIQNKVVYEWNPLKSMFCRGNIAEKLRMASIITASSNFTTTTATATTTTKRKVKERILDMYAGIGYWTLQLAVHQGHLIQEIVACEWNEASLEALHRNIALNNRLQMPKITVLAGDNRQTISEYFDAPNDHAMRRPFDRIIMALLPSSRPGWSTVKHLLLLMSCGNPDQSHQTILHVHENVRKGQEQVMEQELLEYFTNTATQCRVLKRTCVKSFAPKVFHWVFDIIVTLRTIDRGSAHESSNK